MKHLTSADSQYELLEVKELLSKNGIPALLQPELAPYSKASLYVLIDEQYTDAFELMKDPGHHVSNPIDEELIAQLEATANSSTGVLWGSIGKYAIAAVLFVFIGYIFFVGLLS
jgi:hypothetical protein